MAGNFHGFRDRTTRLRRLYQLVSDHGPPREGRHISAYVEDYGARYDRSFPPLLCTLSWSSPSNSIRPRFEFCRAFLETSMSATTYHETIVNGLPPRDGQFY